MTLVDRAAGGLLWNVVGLLFRLLVQLASQVVILQNIGPSASGTFANSLIIVNIGLLLVDLGISTALIYQNDLGPPIIASLTAYRWTATTVLLLLFLGSAGAISVIFNDPLLREVLSVLAILLPLQALMIIPQAVMRRDLRFKEIQRFQMISSTAGFLFVGCTASYLGAGVWSMVAAWLCYFAVNAFLLRRACPAARPTTRIPLHRHTAAYGLKSVGVNLVNWTIDNLDSLVVARLFSPMVLGNYSVAYNLARMPASQALISVQGVLLPSVSTAHREGGDTKAGYLATLTIIAAVALPAFWTLAACSQTVILALYGPDWALAIALLPALAIAVSFHCVMAVNGPILSAHGRVGTEMRVQAVVALAMAGGLIMLTRPSPATIAWVVAVIYGARMLFMIVAAAAVTKCRPSEVAAALGRPAIAAVIIAAGASALDRYLRTLELPPPLVLAAIIATGAALLFLVLTRFASLTLGEKVVADLRSGLGESRNGILRRATALLR